jgi:hypothetical protein
MAHEYGVVARGVQLAVDGVVLGGARQHFSAFERDHLVDEEVPLEVGPARLHLLDARGHAPTSSGLGTATSSA